MKELEREREGTMREGSLDLIEGWGRRSCSEWGTVRRRKETHGEKESENVWTVVIE